MAYPSDFTGKGARVSKFEIAEATANNSVVVVTLRGELRLENIPELRQRFVELLGARMSLVVDLTHLDYIDSTGLGLLAGAKKRASSNGLRLTVVCAPNGFNHLPVYKALEITGLLKVLEAKGTVQEALEAATTPVPK